jgi:hypothetical protein
MFWQKWSQHGLNAMGKLVADIIVETLQNAGVKHCYGVVGDTLSRNCMPAHKRSLQADQHGPRSGRRYRGIRFPGGVWNAVRSLENIQVRDLMKLLGRVKVGQPGTVTGGKRR